MMIVSSILHHNSTILTIEWDLLQFLGGATAGRLKDTTSSNSSNSIMDIIHSNTILNNPTDTSLTDIHPIPPIPWPSLLHLTYLPAMIPLSCPTKRMPLETLTSKWKWESKWRLTSNICNICTSKCPGTTHNRRGYTIRPTVTPTKITTATNPRHRQMLDGCLLQPHLHLHLHLRLHHRHHHLHLHLPRLPRLPLLLESLYIKGSRLGFQTLAGK